MITKPGLSKVLARLSLMRFFPADPEARAIIAEDLCDLAGGDEQLEWLARRLADLYSEWPGLRECRAVFCARYTARDGRETYSETYPGGIPSETGRLENAPSQLAPGRAAALIGAPVIAKQISAAHAPMPSEAEINQQWEAIKARNAAKAEALKPKAVLPDLPPKKPITQADFALLVSLRKSS